MIKSNINKEMVKFQISEKEKIFSIDNSYHVASTISDCWILGNSIWFETTMTSYQKSYIVLTEFGNGTLNIRHTQKQWPENRYANILYTVLDEKELNFEKKEDYYLVFLTGNNFLKLYFKKFNLVFVNSNDEVILETNTRKGYEYLENYITPPIGFKQIKDDIKKPLFHLN